MVTQSVKKANDRTRVRKGTILLKKNAVIAAWDGFCSMCECAIYLNVGAHESQRAVIDRVDPRIITYHQNFQWSCVNCNAKKKDNVYTTAFVFADKLASAGHGKRLPPKKM